jgi:uncharacterized protein YkwD
MKKSTLVWLLTPILILPVRLYSQQRADDTFKQEFLQSINHTRAQGCRCGITLMPPVPPLTWNDLLENAALAHARDMDIHNYFSHESRNGKSSADRIFAIGYNYNGYKSFTVGENIAMGQQTIAEVMRGWFKSEGHCKNLMNPDFKEIGVAQYDTYWVQDFGGREPFSAEQQKLIKSGRMKITRKALPSN